MWTVSFPGRHDTVVNLCGPGLLFTLLLEEGGGLRNAVLGKEVLHQLPPFLWDGVHREVTTYLQPLLDLRFFLPFLLVS